MKRQIISSIYKLHNGKGNDFCYYCGDPPTGVDHVPPVHITTKLYNLDPDLAKSLKCRLVHCCPHCNSILGGQLINTLEERKRHIKEYFKRKYKKILSQPRWTDEELESLGPVLRTSVEAAMQKRARIEMRLFW